MKATDERHRNLRARLLSAPFTSTLFLLFFLAVPAAASMQVVLERGSGRDLSGEYTGVVDLAIKPGFDNAKVTVLVDGQKVADGLLSPHHLVVDFGPTAVQHRITVIARTPQGRRVQWSETINRGMLPLGVKITPADLGARLFDVEATAPKDDPIATVQLWHEGKAIASDDTAPYRFTVPEEMIASGFVQVTAKTQSGEEAADFWSAAGNVLGRELQIRTVPIFVSVVDRNGMTRDDVERSQFRIIDGNAEAEIIEFGKAFDQPISIALLLDASASMTYSMQHATKAAAEFVKHALKEGDRASITAVQDVPRRRQPLTNDRNAISAALDGIQPQGRTSLYDAVASAIRELREEKNRRAIVVLTDGSDTASVWSYGEMEQLAREAAIPIYFIAYEGGLDTDGARDLDRLRYVAAQTGGFVATATQQNLMARYQAIEKDLRAQFAITYQVSDFGKSNEWRPVRVVVDSPKLTARTIKGYFAP
jgi:VWFA-related protein